MERCDERVQRRTKARSCERTTGTAGFEQGTEAGCGQGAHNLAGIERSYYQDGRAVAPKANANGIAEGTTDGRGQINRVEENQGEITPVGARLDGWQDGWKKHGSPRPNARRLLFYLNDYIYFFKLQRLFSLTESFEGFDSKILEFKQVHHMSGTLGRIRQHSATLLVGNKNGICGVAIGKSMDSRAAIKSAKNRAAKRLFYIKRYDEHTGKTGEIYQVFGKLYVK